MKLKSIGELKQGQFEKWWESKKISVPYFNEQKIKFIVEKDPEDKSIEDFDQAITNFLSLDKDERNKINEAVFKNYKEFTEKMGNDLNLKDEKEVWGHIDPHTIMVIRRPKDQIVYIQICADCDWEKEHGLQIVYRKGKEFSRISEQDGFMTDEDANGKK